MSHNGYKFFLSENGVWLTKLQDLSCCRQELYCFPVIYSGKVIKRIIYNLKQQSTIVFSVKKQ